MYIHVGNVVKFVVFKVKLVFWLQGTFILGRLQGEKTVFYSRVDVPVVYTLKNLLYGLAFSDFVWGYFSGHYKMRTNTIKKKSRE